MAFYTRQKISKDGIPAARSCIQELEADWDRKWSETLTAAPLAAFLKEDHVSGNAPMRENLQTPSPWLLSSVFQVVGFLSPMAPLSFEPVAEARCGIFSQFPATLLGERQTRFCAPVWCCYHGVLCFSGDAGRGATTGSGADALRSEQVLEKLCVL